MWVHSILCALRLSPSPYSRDLPHMKPDPTIPIVEVDSMKKTLFGLTGTVLFAMMVAGSSAEATTIFSYSGAVVDYTVPVTGIYLIAAAGAGRRGFRNRWLGCRGQRRYFARRRHAVEDRGGRCAPEPTNVDNLRRWRRRWWQFCFLTRRIPAPHRRRRRRRCRRWRPASGGSGQIGQAGQAPSPIRLWLWWYRRLRWPGGGASPWG